MTIRPATPLDLPAIEAIQLACPEAAAWSAADYLHYDCRVAEWDNAVIAFLVRRSVGPDAEILNLAVAPTFRRRGIARALLAEVLSVAGVTFFLEVRVSNQAAIQLYSAAGFIEAGQRRGYYDHPVEDAVVMRRNS